jgi:hypothetical protein
LNKIAKTDHRRKPSAERERDDARAVGGNESILHNVKCVRWGERFEGWRDIFRTSDFESRDFDAEGAGAHLSTAEG